VPVIPISPTPLIPSGLTWRSRSSTRIARVTTDGHDSYPRAIRTELGKDVKHRTNRFRQHSRQNHHNEQF
jgi:hypothetical protein